MFTSTPPGRARVAGIPESLAALLLLCAGCGDGGPELAEVTGTVTLDGKPVRGALLEFVPQGAGASTAWAGTDEGGRYEVAFGQSRKGMFLGRALVRITSDDRVSIGGEEYTATEVFPPKYNSKSELYVEVAAGENEFDFNCKSDDFQPRQRREGGGGA